MPRSPRADEAGGLHHALNRVNLLCDEAWGESFTRRLNLESIMRPRGRKRVRFPKTDIKKA